MKRSIIARALFATAAACALGITGAGLAQASTGASYFDDDGWQESTIDLGVEGQVLMIQTGR
ncbi:hypothetical protein [Rhodococcus zopfii]|uniref:hypothetical protein n=1 Tax=Rhodococcus zopfii TaxID=43772 RepID=UPI000933B000|nr:hypothetical protein [Rhodococcus zopfii]